MSCTSRLIVTEYSGMAYSTVLELGSQADIIIAIGGDGTCNEVVNGMMNLSHQPILAIVPFGTGNDFASAHAPFEINTFLRSLEALKHEVVDVGKIQFSDEERYFLNIADIGFGGHVVTIMNRQRELGLRGKISYGVAILRAFVSFKKPTLKITGTAIHHTGKTLFAAFCNGSMFADGLTISPESSPFDQQMELVIIGDVSLMEYIRNLKNLKQGKRIHHPEVHYLKLNDKTTVEVIEGVAFTELDGEMGSSGGITISMIPRGIKLLR